ncbi:MAG: hypothetical protein KJ955_05350 [Nanoarchaeota archaeon]|nr:hypothetical protein [Nanoarchaeota archaeon]
MKQDKVKQLEKRIKAIEARLKEQDEEDRILETGTESDVIGRRKDGSRIFGKPHRLKEAGRSKK